jgi:integrase
MAKISVRKCANKARPHLKWVVNVNDGGKRCKRAYFKTEEKAEAEVRRLENEFRNHGKRGLNIDERLVGEALDANEKLQPLGISLGEVVADYLRRRGQVSITVADLSRDFLASREARGAGVRHMTSLRCVLKRFGEAFDVQRVNDVRSEKVEGRLRGIGGSSVTFNSYRTLVHSLFAFGVRRKACAENPVKHVEREKVKRGKVGILTVDQLRKLLAKSTGDVRATVVIGAFAGLRPEEVARLTWEEVDLANKRIEVNELKAKTGSHRFVEVLPCLDAWIRPLMGSGLIQGDNFRRRYEEGRREAGFALRGNRERRSEIDDNALIPWPHDALLHSFASYHLAKFGQLDRLALQLGHESTRVTFRHYRERVTEQDGQAYFEVLP